MRVDADKIAALAEEVAKDELVELVDLEIAREGPRSVVRVFLDREGGVTLRDCEAFSRRLGALLDVEDPVAGPYSLEVSSPGLNRRLKAPRHFAACRGKRVRVSLSSPVEGSRNFRGILLGSDEEGIELERDGRSFRLPYRLMRRANVEVTNEELFGKGTGRR
ncbi:MAG TPA: ribosome maturation factor RimP, partial [Candidatus Aquicultoraceae bacterium]|nr:ribosome maturation factor RimP [Candidatus Aquicultoraceae bacterium]